MNRTGAVPAVHALEELGIDHTFGIPGVHNTELYDVLGASDQMISLLRHPGGQNVYRLQGSDIASLA